MSETTTVTSAPTTSAAAAKPVLLDEEGKKLFDKYQEVTTNLKKVEKAKEVLTAQKNSTVKALFDKHGKGPYSTPEGDQIIVSRGDTYFFKTAYKKEG